MIKGFIIKNINGDYFHLKEIFNSITFPEGYGSVEVATRFPTKGIAAKIAKRHKVRQPEIEEAEI